MWFDPAETSGIVTPFMVLYGFGARVVEPALGLITGYAFSGPY